MGAAAGHPGPRTRSFRNPTGFEILRLIGTGGQAVCPPSLHPSGQRRAWNAPGPAPGRLARVDYDDLRCGIEGLAAACGWTAHAVRTGTVGQTSVPVSPGPLDPWLKHRIERYLDSCPAARSGCGGHPQLFKVAIVLAHGFALDADTAMGLLSAHYNPRCQPQWTVQELRHKVEDALRVPHGKPRGHLRSGDAKPAMADDTPALIRRAFDARVKAIAARTAVATRREVRR